MNNINSNGNAEEVVSVKRWLGVMIILTIPLVNIVMLLVWMCKAGGNKNVKNYCKGLLLYTILSGVFVLAPIILALYTIGAIIT